MQHRGREGLHGVEAAVRVATVVPGVPDGEGVPARHGVLRAKQLRRLHSLRPKTRPRADLLHVQNVSGVCSGTGWEAYAGSIERGEHLGGEHLGVSGLPRIPLSVPVVQ